MKKTLWITGAAIGCLLSATLGVTQLKTARADTNESVFTMCGAGIRFNSYDSTLKKDTAGMRFEIKAKADAVTDNLTEVGFLVVPTYMLDEGLELTIDNIEKDGDIKRIAYSGETLQDKFATTDESGAECVSYRTYLYNIPEDMYDTQFSARGYYVENGTTIYTQTVERSVQYVAMRALLDTSAISDKNYGETIRDGLYSPYSTVRREELKGYLSSAQQEEISISEENGISLSNGVIAMNGGNEFTLAPASTDLSIGAANWLKGEFSSVHLHGKAAINQMLDIEFTGKNMPYIGLFEDPEDQAYDITEKKGLFFMNGYYLQDREQLGDCLRAYGTKMVPHSNLWGESYKIPNSSAFGRSALQENGRYRLIIGVVGVATSKDTGLPTAYQLRAAIYRINDDGTETQLGYFSENVVPSRINNLSDGDKAFSADYFNGGSIGIYAPTKYGTTVKINGVYERKDGDDYGQNRGTLAWMQENNVVLDNRTGENIEIGENNTFTLPASDNSTSGALTREYANIKLNGNYGLGTMLDINFKGKGMPYISFFEDPNAQGNYDIAYKKGILFFNGFSTPSGELVDYALWSGGSHMVTDDGFWNNSDGKNCLDGTKDASSPFSLCQLNENMNYRLIIGILSGAETETDVNLSQYRAYARISSIADDGTETILGTIDKNVYLKDLTDADVKDSQKTFALRYFDGGSIGIYAPMKYGATVRINGVYNWNSNPTSVDATTKTWMQENNVTISGVTEIGADNTFALAPALTVVRDAKTYQSNQMTLHSYIAFNENYGLNNYLDIEFKGREMPYIGFFENAVSTSLFAGNGIVLSGGIYKADGSAYTLGKNMAIYGPDKAFDTYWGNNRQNVASVGRDSLEENVTYRMLVGYSQNSEGAVLVHCRLYNTETGAKVDGFNFDNEVNAEIYDKDVKRLNGKIVVYSATATNEQATTVKVNGIYKSTIAKIETEILGAYTNLPQ